MTTLTNHSHRLIATQPAREVSSSRLFDHAEVLQSTDNTESVPARGIILGIVGGIAMWGMIIWTVAKFL